MAVSPYAGDLLVYAAYRCDLGTACAFISHGVGVDTIERALGELRFMVQQFAVTRGYSVTCCQRVPISTLSTVRGTLELAASRGHQEAVQFLTTRGARAITGNEPQRQKAAHDQVLDDIREMNRARESPTP
jgi:hypothetical protein